VQKIAAVASALTITPREQSWNATLLNIAGNDINAVTLHYYPSIATGSANSLPSTASLLAGATTNWQSINKYY